MKTLDFSITINAPVAKVRSTMLDHPTYEQWTTAFAEGSTYTGSWAKDTDITFHDPAGYGMIATIEENKLYEYISIHHLGEIGEGKKITMYESSESFENYRFTKVDDHTTKLDVEMTALPEDYIEMFNDMWPKALDILKKMCEA